MRRLEQSLRRLLPAVARTFYHTADPGPVTASILRRILVVRQHNQLGDMLCVVPLLRALHQAFPRALIDLLASPGNAEVMIGHRLLNEVVLYNKQEYLGPLGLRPSRVLALAKDLRAREYDLVIVPATVSVSLTSDILAAATGARYRIGAGSIDGRPNPGSFLYNLPVDLDWRGTPHRHQTLRNADIARGFAEVPDDLSHELTLSPEEIEAGGAEARSLRTNSDGPLVALHPGAGKPPNRWPATRFVELAGTLVQEFGARIAVTIGPMDGEVHRELENSLENRSYFVVNRPVRQVASILKHMDLVVSNDTGIMHVAAAVRAPLVALFGPTDPRQWAPIDAHVRYIHGDPITSITLEQVLETIRALLKATAPGAQNPQGFPQIGPQEKP